ncbi:hypothetical protein C2845_PM01G04320 [Panicum miliaceum]|uniref:pectinesterase n=1 Tax=Panicum miliaceum TaxID=4540 RepID=A0A3L6TKD4_PANMI|nr:hypothetical protein C2845_PM01G04320 [Panicum miliaceum]
MGDRRVLVVVSPELAAFGYDGAGSFANLQDAVDAVPLNNQVRTIIRIAPGVHRQLVHIPISQDQELHLIKDTVICCDNTAARIKHTQSSEVIGTGTFSATVIVEGDYFIAENVIFKNSAPQLYGQAAAACVTADRKPYICMVESSSSKTVKLKVGLGSWEPLGRIVFAETFMDHCIEPAGWHNWDKPENEQTACFCEYRCSGPGSSMSERVPWCKELVGDEAIPFLVKTFVDPDVQNPWLLHRSGQNSQFQQFHRRT